MQKNARFGVEEIIPVNNLASVPELPKFKDVFGFADREPSPLPKTLYFLILF